MCGIAGILQSDDRFNSADSMKRGQHQVACERGLNSNARRLFVSDLAYQHDIGILPQN